LFGGEYFSALVHCSIVVAGRGACIQCTLPLTVSSSVHYSIFFGRGARMESNETSTRKKPAESSKEEGRERVA